jgi:hypothetical protein
LVRPSFFERARLKDQPGLLEFALVDFLCHLQHLPGYPARHHAVDEDVLAIDPPERAPGREAQNDSPPNA